MPIRWTLWPIAAILFLPAGAAAQGLVELAEKEKKRQEAAEGKVYTGRDLRSAGATRRRAPDSTATAPTGGETGSGEAADAAGGEQAEKTPYELRQESAAAWREQLDAARAEVTRLQGEVDQIQTSLNDLTVGFFTASRNRREAQLEQARTDLQAAQQEVSRLETEGRRNGYR